MVVEERGVFKMIPRLLEHSCYVYAIDDGLKNPLAALV